VQRAKWIVVPGVAVAIALAVAACGGSSSSSKSTTSTTPGTSTTGGGSNKRLTVSQWQVYQTKDKTFVSVNTEAIAKFRSCGAVSGRTTSPDVYAKCMGDATTKVISATTDLGTTLNGFHPGTGACGTSLTSYVGALYQWRSVVKTVDSAIKSAAPGSSGAAANARTQYPAVQAAAKTFTKDCRPVGA
jgi:hypothetical protein